MKKLVLTLFVICTFGLLSSNAQKIRVTDGDLSLLKGQKLINLEFTYNDLKVGKMSEQDYLDRKVKDYNKKEAGRGERFVESWKGDRETRYEVKFMELLSKYLVRKGTGVDTDVKNSEYKMVINTFFIEPGFNIGITRRNAAVSMTIDVYKTSTNEKVATVTIKNSPGTSMGNDYDTGERISEAYAKAGKSFAKFLLKKKYI